MVFIEDSPEPKAVPSLLLEPIYSVNFISPRRFRSATLAAEVLLRARDVLFSVLRQTVNSASYPVVHPGPRIYLPAPGASAKLNP
jgi:hypothetical protein